MQLLTKNSLLLFLGILIFNSCSDDDDDTDAMVEEKKQPNAVITVNSSVAPLDTVFVSGLNSENASGFEWSGTDPQGNTIAYTNTTANETYFIPKTVGSYSVKLRVTYEGRFDESSTTVNVSGAAPIGGTLSSSLRLTNLSQAQDSCDYFLQEDLIIPAGVTLDIEEGVRICVAEDVAIISEGTFNADGYNNVATIFFEPLGNNWKGIHLKAGNADIDGLTIEGAGSASFSNDPDENAAMYIGINPLNISHVNFKNNDGFGLVMKKGIEVVGSYSATFEDNTSGPAILSLEHFIKFPSISSVSNSSLDDRIRIRGGSTTQNFGIPSSITGFLILDDIAASNISIGNSVSMADSVGLYATSNFSAQGSANTPILITGENATSGSWKGIVCRNASLRHTTIQHAGSMAQRYPGGFTNIDFKAGIQTRYLTEMENSTVSDNDGYGIVVIEEDNLNSLSDNSIDNNSNGAVVCPPNLVKDFASSTANITYNGYNSTQAIINIHAFDFSKIAESGQTANWNKVANATSDVDYKFLTGSYEVRGDWMIENGVNLECEANVQIEVVGAGANMQAIASGSSSKINFRGTANINGFWDGIYINGQASLNLDYVDINFGGGGNNVYQGCLNVVPTVNAANSSVTNCSFLNGGTYDLYFPGGIDAIGIKDIGNNNTFVNTN